MDTIYLDHNATTPLLPEAWEAMRPLFFERYANPASSHRPGRQARRALEDARDRLAHLLGAHADEVIFTSGATEANNLAVFGMCGSEPGAVLANLIEHPCVVEPIAQLQARGFRQVSLPVDGSGLVQLPKGDVHVLAPTLKLAALMLANHETGAIQPVAELADLLAGAAPLHCDAAAAAGKMPISFHQLGVATMTISAHKFGGPKGVGALLVNRCAKVRPQLWGGHQQHARRPGTEPVPLAVGMAVALEWCLDHLEATQRRLASLRVEFLKTLRSEAGPVQLNGPEQGGLANTINLSFPGIKADVLLMSLDLAGIACATGSACSSGSLLPSPVIKAMGAPPDVLHSAMRFSLGTKTDEAEVRQAANLIVRVVNGLRKLPDDAP